MANHCEKIFRLVKTQCFWNHGFISRFQQGSMLLNIRKKVFNCRQVPRRFIVNIQQPKQTTILPRQVETRHGDFIVRKAERVDKEGVMNIRKEMYRGLDFLPDMYDQLISPPNGQAFLAQNGDEIVWFMSTMLIDNGEHCYCKGTRISQALEGKNITLTFLALVSEWALSNGASKFVGTNTNYARSATTVILDMNHMIYLMQPENIHLSRRDLDSAIQALNIPFSNLVAYFQSNDISTYLFPSQRIMVDIVPYKLIASNIALMNGFSGKHTTAYTDVRIENGAVRGMLSFGTLFKAQAVSYVYGIEIYGTDVESVQRHVLRHVLEIQQRVSGTICLMLFVQNDFPKKIADEMCLKYGMSRINQSDTELDKLDLQREIVIEKDFMLKYI